MSGSDSRFDRQRLLPWLGDAGQQRLRGARALIVGCGALGSAQAELLVRAGVGALTIVDRDLVEWSNLQRQCLFGEREARDAAPKAEAAKRRLREIDSSVRIDACVEHLDRSNAADLARGADVIVDGLDNMPTRYLLNDLAVRDAIPFVHAAVVGMEGRSLAVLPGRPCLRCVHPRAPAPGALPTCDTAGVFGPAVAMVAGIASAQAIRVLAGRVDLVSRGLWSVDLDAGRAITIGADEAPAPECSCCGRRSFEWLDGTEEEQATVLCGRGAVQVVPHGKRASVHAAVGRAEVDLESMRARLAPHGRFEERDGVLRGTLASTTTPEGGAIDLAIFGDGRAIVGGTADPVLARSIYDRFVGL